MPRDLVIVGGGPGGFAAAKAAVKAGISVALVEREFLGGTCLNWGCIPTKMLLGGTACVDEFNAQAKLKIASGKIDINLTALQTKKTRFIEATRKAMVKQLEQLGVKFLSGLARFDSATSLEVQTSDGTLVQPFKHCIVAAGSAPAFFPGMEPDGKCVLDSNAMLDATEVPESLIIVGGGVIGLEMGQIFHRLGSQITIVEAMDRLAPWEDKEVSTELGRIYKRKGWKLRLGERVDHLTTRGGGAELTFESGDVITAAKALVCVGRRSVADAMLPQKAGVEQTQRGWIQVDEFLRASKNIYAIGDVNARSMLAHAAEDQARYVVNHITGQAEDPYDDSAMPSCIYGSPETFRVGKMAEELRNKGKIPETSRFALAANPIAQSHAATQGFVKVVWESDRVVGITGVGHGVTGLLTLSTVMVKQGWTRKQVDDIVFPHPTLDEALMEALHATPQV